MRRNVLAIFFTFFWALVTILALTWGVEFDWPDYVHVNYGYPLVWGTHTLNTFLGSVDIWKVDPAALFTDLAIWLGVMVIGLSLILMLRGGSKLLTER